MVDIDSETLFNAAAAIVATIAAVMFILSVDTGYSPATTVTLVLAFLAGILLITQVTEDYQLTVLGYGVIVITGVALYFELVNTFDADTIVTVTGLLVIAAALFGLRSWLDEADHLLTGTQARTLFVAVLVLAAVVAAVDVATGGPVYDLQPDQRVEFPTGDRGHEVRIGTLLVRNPTPLPERVDAPHYEACTAGDWTPYRTQRDPGEPPRPVRINLDVQDGYNEHVFGFATKTYPAVLHADPSALGGESFPVRRTESCPTDETGSPYIAVFEQPDRF